MLTDKLSQLVLTNCEEVTSLVSNNNILLEQTVETTINLPFLT